MSNHKTKTKTKTKTKWTLIKAFIDGHRYYHKHNDPTVRVYIADSSGATPDLTAGGPLYIDKDRPVEVVGIFVRLPTVRPDGSTTTVAASLDEALWLSSQFNLTFGASGIRFKINVC